VRLAVKVVMQNDGEFADVNLGYKRVGEIKLTYELKYFYIKHIFLNSNRTFENTQQ